MSCGFLMAFQGHGWQLLQLSSKFGRYTWPVRRVLKSVRTLITVHKSENKSIIPETGTQKVNIRAHTESTL
jgi:hypothetical protein